jgi:glycosyltransferase involved in cell wall biosynthesis
MPATALPEVAVGLPCYNRPKLLDQALAAIRAQTYPALRILVSDDAAPDPAVDAVARRHAGEDPRIRYVRHERNIGMNPNFEYVLNQSTSPYFMWLSDDDWHEPDFVARCVEKLQHEGPGVVSVITEVQHETPEGPYRFFSQGAAFRKAVSTDPVERLEMMVKEVYSHQMYGVHRRDALYHNGKTVFSWFGGNGGAVEFPMMLVLALKGNLIALPGAGFHKRERAITCALTEWGVRGGVFPKNKLRQRIFGQLKNVRRHVASYQDYKAGIQALGLDAPSEQRVLRAARQAIVQHGLDVARGWRAPVIEQQP